MTSKVTQIVDDDWELRPGPLGPALVSFPLYPVDRSWGTCFATATPPMPSTELYLDFPPICPRFPSLVAAQKCVYRDCDLDAIVRSGPEAWGFEICIESPEIVRDQNSVSYKITVLHYYL